MKALTLYASWAHAIAHGSKRVENRTWHPPRSLLGTRIAIHAGKTLDMAGLDALDEIDNAAFVARAIPRSAIVATAKVMRSVEFRGLLIPSDADPAILSDWWAGPVGWVLEDVRALAVPVPCKGALGLWDVPPDLAAAIERQEVLP